MTDEKRYVELVGDKTEVTVKMTVGQLVAIANVVNTPEAFNKANVCAAAAEIAEPGKGAHGLIDYANMLVAVNDALAKSQGLRTLYGAHRAMIDQAEAKLRDAA